MYSKNYNKNKYRGVDRETIIYDVIDNIKWSTGPTGYSSVKSVIDENGIMSKNIVPYADNSLHINSELHGLYTNQIVIDDILVHSLNNHINFPYSTTIDNVLPASIVIKGILNNITLLPLMVMLIW